LAGSEIFAVRREMGCTLEDLLRWLPEALGDLYPQTSLIVDDQKLLAGEPARILMQGAALRSRKIALLLIPVLELEIIFDASFSAEHIQSILARFDLYTRRGGG